VQLKGQERSPGELLVGGGGLTFLLTMVLPWFSAGDVTRRGLSFWITGILPLLLLAVVVGSVWLDGRLALPLRLAAQRLPVDLATAQQVLAWGATLLVLVRLAFGATYESINPEGSPLAVDLDQQPGIYLAVFAAAAVGVGLVLKAWDLGRAEEGSPEGPPAS